MQKIKELKGGKEKKGNRSVNEGMVGEENAAKTVVLQNNVCVRHKC